MSVNTCHTSIYDFPDVYDAVLRRPVGEINYEVRSVVSLLKRREVLSGRILELACGTCTHGILLAQAGFQVAGMDMSRTMLDGARDRAEASNVSLELFEGDWTNFRLDTEPFDAVLFMSETFPLITEYEDIVSHFCSVRRHLKPDGIYIVDVDVNRRGINTESAMWGKRTVPFRDGSIEIWNEDFPGDWVRGTNRMVMHCRFHVGEAVVETADEWVIRNDSPWNLSVLILSLGKDWSLDGFYSWRDLDTDISDEAHYLMVVNAM